VSVDGQGMAQRRGQPTGPDHQAIVEQALVGVYVVQHERIVYANPRLAEIFGYDVPSLLALPSIVELIDEADRAMVADSLRRRIAGEITSSTHVMRGVRRDGTRVEVEVYSTRAEHHGEPAVTGTMVDATTRRARERELEAREQRFRELIENAADVVYTCDLQGRVTSMNRAGERLTGYSTREAIGRHVSEFMPDGQRGLVEELIERQVRDRQEALTEFEIRTRAGERRVLEVRTRLVDRDGETVEIQGIARDITDRKEQERALRSLTIVDDLTRLYNRRGFLTLAERHLKLAARKKSGVYLLFADVDGLKVINDTFGHLEGDRALVDAADILRCSFRSADIIARLGGDEFTVFPIEAADGTSQILIDRLEEQLRRHNEANAGRGYRLTFSVGIARFEPDSSWTIDQLLEQADKALYQQKRNRRG
jgi:diguanylate cyclase (GGDEF)-like protein/PAS domain S-box-containing protein